MTVRQLSDLDSDGTVLGQSASDKIAFFGATPVVQQTHVAAVSTTAATTTSPWGFSTSTQADAIVSLVNQCRTALVNTGLMASS